MATKQFKSNVAKVSTCPVCLRNSHKPIVLQCMHCICRECISKQDEIQPGYAACIFCKTSEPVKDNFQKGQSLNVGPYESEQSKQIHAKFQCDDCLEYLCEECKSVHAKLKVSKHHIHVPMMLSCDDTPPTNNNVCEECKVDNRREVGFFCKDHNLRCCGTCAIRVHRRCTVYDIENLVENIKSEGLIDDLKLSLEDSKKTIDAFVKACKENNTKLEEQVDNIRKSVRDLRKNLATLLDEFENDINIKTSHILETEKAKNNDNIKTCLKYSTAVEQSCRMFEDAVDTASNMDFYEMFNKIENHSTKYASFRTDVLEDKPFVELELNINKKLCELLTGANVGTIIEKKEKAQITPARKKSIKRTKVVRAVTKSDGKIPRYSSAAYLPNGTVCLLDCNNKRCGLFDRFFNILDFVSFRSCPWSTAYVCTDELAVTLPLENKV